MLCQARGRVRPLQRPGLPAGSLQRRAWGDTSGAAMALTFSVIVCAHNESRALARQVYPDGGAEGEGPVRPISSSRACKAGLVRLSRGRLAHSSIRRFKIRAASRNARRLASSEIVTAAGSGTPQCAVIGCPGQKGHCSAAASSHTVNTKCMCGASGPANSSQLLLRRPSVRMPCCSRTSRASGSTAPLG